MSLDTRALEILETWTGAVCLIRRIGGAWLGELVPSGPIAAALLDRCMKAPNICFRRSVTVRPLDWPKNSGRQPSRLLRDGLKAWDHAQGILSDAMFGTPGLVDATQIYSVDDFEKAPLSFLYIGRDTTTTAIYGREWTAGATFATSVPDEAFSAEIVTDLAAIATGQEPKADIVHARLRRLDGDYLWLAYERLALPMRLVTGRPLLTTFTSFIPFALDPVPLVESAQKDPAGPCPPNRATQ